MRGGVRQPPPALVVVADRWMPVGCKILVQLPRTARSRKTRAAIDSDRGLQRRETAAADRMSSLQHEALGPRRKARREKQARREEFPSHLERRERVIDLSEEEKEGLTPIGVKVTERGGVRSMPPPLLIVESCKYDFSVIAAVSTMKFAFHMPTYRQQDWFAQCGWFPSCSTTNDLINYGVNTIVPLYRQMWNSLLQQPILLGDDTRLRVLLRGALDKEMVGGHSSCLSDQAFLSIVRRRRTQHLLRFRASRCGKIITKTIKTV